MARETRPWQSTAMSQSRPIAERTAARRSATPSALAGVSIALSSELAFIFSAVKPSLMRSRASWAISSVE